LVLVVDDEPDVEELFRQQFRRDLRAQRFAMDFAISAADALARIANTVEQSLILILSDINMPGMTGLEMLPKVKEMRPDVPVIMITAYPAIPTSCADWRASAPSARDRARSGSARCRKRYPQCPSWSARRWVCSWRLLVAFDVPMMAPLLDQFAADG
jgi:CheY-like chemotaxis protein